MQRRSTSQDISWFLDLRGSNQIELDPPYQRRSVWNRKDSRYFLDTIFRGYPCPAIFLHKTVNEEQKTIYAVVDGKQRLLTIFKFVDGEISIDPKYGDARLDGKKWADLQPAERQHFWDYVVPVEFLIFDTNDTQVVNQAFDRLNRNMRKLEPQELRHARWSGWFITLVESECEDQSWRKLGVVTNARTKRMKDAQFISELLLVVIERKQVGFDQQAIDAAYALYDDVGEEDLNLNLDEDEVKERLSRGKEFLTAMQAANGCVKTYAGTVTNLYTLWSLVILHRDKLPEPARYAVAFEGFMQKVRELDGIGDAAARVALITKPGGEVYTGPLEFLQATKGATTDSGPRTKRLEALLASVPSV